MFVGVPAGIITVLLVLAAFLVALYGPSFREGNSLPAISAFCTCNLLAVLHLHLRQLCACTCVLLKLLGKEMFKIREKPPKVRELLV